MGRLFRLLLYVAVLAGLASFVLCEAFDAEDEDELEFRHEYAYIKQNTQQWRVFSDLDDGEPEERPRPPHPKLPFPHKPKKHDETIFQFLNGSKEYAVLLRTL